MTTHTHTHTPTHTTTTARQERGDGKDNADEQEDHNEDEMTSIGLTRREKDNNGPSFGHHKFEPSGGSHGGVNAIAAFLYHKFANKHMSDKRLCQRPAYL